MIKLKVMILVKIVMKIFENIAKKIKLKVMILMKIVMKIFEST